MNIHSSVHAYTPSPYLDALIFRAGILYTELSLKKYVPSPLVQ